MNSPSSKRWLSLFLLISGLGALVSSYALYHQIEVSVFGASDSACNLNAVFNCDRVAKSRFSVIFGIPLASFGLAYFFSMLGVLAYALRSPKRYQAAVETYVLFVVTGAAVTLILSLISAFGVGAYCLICMCVYLVCFLQVIFVLIYRWKSTGPIFGKAFVSLLPFTAILLIGFIALFDVVQLKMTRDFEIPEKRLALHHFLIRLFHLPPRTIEVNLHPKAGELGDIYLGNPDAPIQIVEFVDYQCPFCGDLAPILKQVHEEFKDRVVIVLKNLPVDKACNAFAHAQHRDACNVSLMARCAWDKGVFDEFYDHAFNLSPNVFMDYPGKEAHEIIASMSKLSAEDLNRCVHSDPALAKIKADISLSQTLSITATPAVFVDGYRFPWRTLDMFRAELSRHTLISQNKSIK